MVTIKLDNLPNELFPLIFKHLDLISLTRSRLVSKRWMSLIDEHMKIDELIISKSNDKYNSSHVWFYINKSIDMNRVIETKFLCFYLKTFGERLISVNILQNLKRLKVNCNSLHNWDIITLCDLDFVWSFTKLEQLDLEYRFEIGTKSVNICHFNLKILYIPTTVNCDFEINCPNLNAIKLSCDCNLNNVLIHHPLSIECIEAEYKLISRMYNDFKYDLTKYKNLRILRVPTVDNLNNEILNQLVNLKELTFLTKRSIKSEYQLIEAIFKKKQLLKLDQLEIFLSSFNEVKNIDDWNREFWCN